MHRAHHIAGEILDHDVREPVPLIPSVVVGLVRLVVDPVRDIAFLVVGVDGLVRLAHLVVGADDRAAHPLRGDHVARGVVDIRFRRHGRVGVDDGDQLMPAVISVGCGAGVGDAGDQLIVKVVGKRVAVERGARTQQIGEVGNQALGVEDIAAGRHQLIARADVS